MIPNDSESPSKASGIRLGSPAMTSRGFKEEEFREVGKIIADVLKNPHDEQVLEKAKERVSNLTKKYPLYK
jgi:glycine hydroxymethyltransferase